MKALKWQLMQSKLSENVWKWRSYLKLFLCGGGAGGGINFTGAALLAPWNRPWLDASCHSVQCPCSIFFDSVTIILTFIIIIIIIIIIEYWIAKSLKIIQGHLKWQPWLGRVQVLNSIPCRHPDMQADTSWRLRPRLCIASRDKLSTIHGRTFKTRFVWRKRTSYHWHWSAFILSG